MRRHFHCLANMTAGAVLVAIGSTAMAAGDDERTIALGEVEGADPMALAEKLLPADIRAVIVEGALRRQFLPGQNYWTGYKTARRAADDDLCALTHYSVELRNPKASGGDAPPDTPLVIGPVEQRELFAVVFPAKAATRASCAATQGYVALSEGDDGARELGAYRSLIAAMHRAREPGGLPFEIVCAPANDEHCRDARAALGSLPLDALYDVDARSMRSLVPSEGAEGLVRRPSIVEGEPFDVELSFGRSGNDGHSWRVSWREDGSPLERIKIARHYVVYH